LIKDYYHSYIAYDELKASLKTPSNDWTEDDEQRFIRSLEQELDKVFTFQHVRSDDIVRRIRSSETEVSDVIGKQQEADNPQSSTSEPPSEEDYELLEADLSDIIADVHDLAKFTQLNYTGFQKIIKKHDVRGAGGHLRFCRLTCNLENNWLASEARLRNETKRKALLEG
jgi:SPX domain protein involved in polyphosphate accumulation